MLVSVLLVIVTAAFGRAFYSAEIPTGASLVRLPDLILAVGASAFCALGFAVASLIPNADASLPIVNAVILPLLLLSGIFIPLGNNPPRVDEIGVGRVFPIKHFLTGMQAGFLGAPFHWTDVLILAAWGVAGLLFAVRFFRWEPRTASHPSKSVSCPSQAGVTRPDFRAAPVVTCARPPGYATSRRSSSTESPSVVISRAAEPTT